MQNSDIYPISKMCNLLGVSKASFYRFYHSQKESKLSKKTDAMTNILKIYNKSKRRFGAPKITKKLHEEGLKISRPTVSKYMKELGIRSIAAPKRLKRTSGKLSLEKHPYIVNRIKNIVPTRINQIWTTDITYIETKAGWVYLSTIIDQYSKKVIAWVVSNRQTSSLVLDTIKQALKARGNPKGVILHSDKGVQYRSKIVRKYLKQNKVIQSFTSIGKSCDENPAQESFHASLKKECITKDLLLYDLEHTKRVLFEYIEGFFNNYRIHMSIKGLTPNAFENLIN